MNFDLSEEQKMLQKTVRDFVKQESTVERFRKLRDADGSGYEKSTWAQMGELGWLAMPFPESVGGFGGSFVDAALILEQLGSTLVPEPYLASVCMAGMALLHGGDAAQHERYLAPMLEGRTTLAFAGFERNSRNDITRIETRAEVQGDDFVLNGQKPFVLNGHAADHIVVSALVGTELALFVVDGSAAGLERKTVRLFDGQRAGQLSLKDVKVSKDARLSSADAAQVITRTIDFAAAASVAEGVGVAQSMLGMTMEYLKTREQFGVKIGSFQALQHRAVEMYVEVELLKSISAEASVRAEEEGTERTQAVSAAKVQLATGAQFVSRASIQLHGGVGVTDEHDIGLFFKRMQVLSVVGGDEVHHVRRYAAAIAAE